MRVNICCLCSGKSSEEYRIMGLRYGSTNLSVGATVTPFSGKRIKLLCEFTLFSFGHNADPLILQFSE